MVSLYISRSLHFLMASSNVEVYVKGPWTSVHTTASWQEELFLSICGLSLPSLHWSSLSFSKDPFFPFSILAFQVTGFFFTSWFLCWLQTLLSEEHSGALSAQTLIHSGDMDNNLYLSQYYCTDLRLGCSLFRALCIKDSCTFHNVNYGPVFVCPLKMAWLG